MLVIFSVLILSSASIMGQSDTTTTALSAVGVTSSSAAFNSSTSSLKIVVNVTSVSNTNVSSSNSASSNGQTDTATIRTSTKTEISSNSTSTISYTATGGTSPPTSVIGINLTKTTSQTIPSKSSSTESMTSMDTENQTSVGMQNGTKTGQNFTMVTIKSGSSSSNNQTDTTTRQISSTEQMDTTTNRTFTETETSSKSTRTISSTAPGDTSPTTFTESMTSTDTETTQKDVPTVPNTTPPIDISPTTSTESMTSMDTETTQKNISTVPNTTPSTDTSPTTSTESMTSMDTETTQKDIPTVPNTTPSTDAESSSGSAQTITTATSGMSTSSSVTDGEIVISTDSSNTTYVGMQNETMMGMNFTMVSSNSDEALLIGATVGGVSFIVIVLASIAICASYRKRRQRPGDMSHLHSESQLANPKLGKRLNQPQVKSDSKTGFANGQILAAGVLPFKSAVRNSTSANHSPFSTLMKSKRGDENLQRTSERKTFSADSDNQNVDKFYFLGSNLAGPHIGKKNGRDKDTSRNGGQARHNRKATDTSENKAKNSTEDVENLYSNGQILEKNNRPQELPEDPKKRKLSDLFRDPPSNIRGRGPKGPPEDVEELYGNKDIIKNKRRAREERKALQSKTNSIIDVEPETSPPFDQLKKKLENTKHMYANQYELSRNHEDPVPDYDYDDSDKTSGVYDNNDADFFNYPPTYDSSNWSFSQDGYYPSTKSSELWGQM